MKFPQIVSPVLFTLALLPVSLHAQKGTVASGGTLSIALNAKFSGLLSSNNINVSYIGKAATNRGEQFSVSGGSVKLSNGVGAVESLGAMTFTEGDQSVALDQFEMLATKNTAYITAEVFTNGTDQGRFPVFVLTRNLFTPPVAYGKYSSGAVQFMINPDFQSEFADYIPINGLKPDEILGNFSMTVTVAKN